MRISSGTTDQTVYFFAADETDGYSPETGLDSFSIYYAKNGSSISSNDTPPITELSDTLMPGVYGLLLDEGTTLAAGNDTEELVLHITATGMRPVVKSIELYRPKITEGNTLTVSSEGEASVAGTTVSATSVEKNRTWYGEDYRATNIIKVATGFAGTFALMPAINRNTTISTVDSVTITGPDSVTASNLSVRLDKKAALFTVSALATAGTYTVLATVTTVDSQTIPTTAELQVV